MFIPVIAAVVGALAMGTTKPRTSFSRARTLGPRSGVTYDVEDFQGAGFIVVRAPDGSEGVFSRKARGTGFDWSRGRGHAGTLKLMRADFGVPSPVTKEPAP